jgi:hypothetical protein
MGNWYDNLQEEINRAKEAVESLPDVMDDWHATLNVATLQYCKNTGPGPDYTFSER